MSALQKLIKREIERLEKRLSKIETEIEDCPAIKILDLHRKSLEAIREHRDNHLKCVEILKPLSAEMEIQQARHKARDESKLWDIKLELVAAKSELHQSLFYASSFKNG